MTTSPAIGACGVRILGTGSCVPDRRLTNDDFARMMDTSDEWITQRTGIKERRVLDLRTEGCSTLAQKALERALENAGVAAEELDLAPVRGRLQRLVELRLRTLATMLWVTCCRVRLLFSPSQTFSATVMVSNRLKC